MNPPKILLSPFMDAIFPRVAIFLVHPWSLRWFQGPLRRWRPIQKWCTLAMSFDVRCLIGCFFTNLCWALIPTIPHMCCVFFYPGALAAMRVVQKQWSVISYHSVMVSPWFCWFPKNVLRKGIGKMKMPPKCQGAIGDLIKGHQDRQVVDGWPVAKNHFH